MKSNPLVSIIMPVYNSEAYLEEAIHSILDQTYQNIQLIIIDDCSIDNSFDIISTISSSKIELYKNEQNMGVSATRNKGITLAKGKYIALMDADDISLPQRIASQVDFMEANPHVGLASSHYESFRKGLIGTKKRIRRLATDANIIQTKLLFSNAVCGAASMMRSDTIKNNGLNFDTSLQMAEDFDLWKRISYISTVKNVDEVLFRYRKHKNNSIKNRLVLNRDYTRVVLKTFQHLELDILDIFDDNYTLKKPECLELLHDRLMQILNMNLKSHKYNQNVLQTESANFLYWVFGQHIPIFGYSLFVIYKRLYLFEFVSISNKDKIALFSLKLRNIKWKNPRI